MIVLKTKFSGDTFVEAHTLMNERPCKVVFRLPHEFSIIHNGKKIGEVMEHPNGWSISLFLVTADTKALVTEVCRDLTEVKGFLRETLNEKEIIIEGYDEAKIEEAKKSAEKICGIELL